MRRRFVVNVKKRYGHLSVVITLLPLPLVETPVALHVHVVRDVAVSAQIDVISF